MNPLERFERMIADVLEGSMARALGARLEPVEIARQIDRAMDDNLVVGPGQPIAPNQFVVSLHRDDLASLGDLKSAIAEELAAYIAHRARERRWHLVGRPLVKFVAAKDGRGKKAPGRSRTLTVTAHVVPDRASTAERAYTQRFPVIAPVRPTPGTTASPRIPGTNSVVPVPATGRAANRRQSPAPTAALEGSGIRLVLEQRTTRIGRALDNDLVLEDSRVSRYHAEIAVRDDGFHLRDLDSTNGTQVNGRPVRECRLQSGDLLSLGGLELQFV